MSLTELRKEEYVEADLTDSLEEEPPCYVDLKPFSYFSSINEDSKNNSYIAKVEKPNEDNESTKSVSPEIENTNDCEDSFVTGSVYMYIKEPRKVKLKPINYVCEWVPKCNFEVQEYSEFYSHVITHLSDIRGVKNECSLNLFCDWKNCEFTTTLASEILAHVVYHAVHASAKNRGLQFFQEYIYKRDPGFQPGCKDPSSTNEIPILPNEFFCDWAKCGLKFNDPQLFYWHVRGHINYSESETCEWKGCRYKHGCRSKFLRHLMRHSGEQTHSCPFCGLSFSGKERLKEHWLRVEHVPVGGAPFECTRCSKTFVSLVLLKEHQRVHAAIKTFSCPICGPSKLFPYQSKLDRHIAQVHSSRRSFQCTVCSYA